MSLSTDTQNAFSNLHWHCPAPALGLESYDDDLAWIAEKLTQRAGADFGFIFRSIAQEEGIALMATATTEHLTVSTAECGILAEIIRDNWARSSEPVTDLLQRIHIPADHAHTEALTLLYMTFQPAPDVVIVAAVCRTGTSFNLLHDMVARRLHPVLLRYVRLWWLHRTERRQSAALSRVLDVSDIGIAVLDRHAEILFINRALQKLLTKCDGLQRLGRGIAPANEKDCAHWQTVLRQATQGNLVPGGSAARHPMLTLRREDGRRALIVTAFAVEATAIDPRDAAVVLYVVDPEQGFQHTLAPACRIYGLTPAESRLVSQLVEGCSITQAAERMKVTLQTARSYLKQIFCKTTTNRQSELIRVMLSSASRTNIGVDLSRI